MVTNTCTRAHLNAATGRRKEKRDVLSYSAGPDERRSSVLSDSFQIEPAGNRRRISGNTVKN